MTNYPATALVGWWDWIIVGCWVGWLGRGLRIGDCQFDCLLCCLPVVFTVDARNPFRTNLKPWLKSLFVGISRGIDSFQGFLLATIQSRCLSFARCRAWPRWFALQRQHLATPGAWFTARIAFRQAPGWRGGGGLGCWGVRGLRGGGGASQLADTEGHMLCGWKAAPTGLIGLLIDRCCSILLFATPNPQYAGGFGGDRLSE